MKFLTIGSIKEINPPPSVVRQLLEAGHAVLNQQKKAGKVLESYYIPGWRRVVAIRESKSAEELDKDISEMPCSALLNLEVYPLADYDESLKIILEGLKAAEKMMPAPTK
jgi:muconolactone delta-isomerase